MDETDHEERVVIRAPRGVGLAIERAAIQAHLTPGDLARRLLIDGLRANGFELADLGAARTADVVQFIRP